jgi:hypothetical protein
LVRVADAVFNLFLQVKVKLAPIEWGRSETGTHLELEAFQAVVGLAFSGLA